MPTDRPIFLVGCPRSGTTLLSAMLHAHPRIAIPPETRFLLPVYRGRARFGDLTVAANRRKLARRMTDPKRTRFLDLGLDRRAVVAQIVAAPPTIGSAAGTVWREFARSRGKARWGEKRPAYWRDMGVIRRLFPDAQFVHLVRDGRACVASMKQLDWWKSGVVGAMASWTLADHELRRLERLPGGSYHRLRYEDLLADPRRELTALCTFLGEPFDDAMLDHAEAARDIVPDRKSWHDRTKGGLDQARIEAWREGLDPAEIGLFELVARRALTRNGYELSGIGRRPSAGALAGYYRERNRRLAVMYKVRLADARLRRRDPQPLADLG